MLDFAQFQILRLKGTMTELTNASPTGAIAQSADSFLEITYPSVDLIKCVKGVAPDQDRIAILMGGPSSDLKQQAFLDAQAFQWGFCSAGTTMNSASLSEEQKQDLPFHPKGNLCRCPGYRSIDDAFHGRKTTEELNQPNHRNPPSDKPMRNPRVLPIVTMLSIACASSFCFADAIAPPKQLATPQQVALDDIKQLNTSMFGIYDKGLAIHEKNFNHPLIMALFSGKGGRFILYRPGQSPLEAPSVPPVYEIMKSTGHCAMGTYALVSPYLDDAKTNQGWVTDMKDYRGHVQTAQDNVDNLDIKPEEKALVAAVLGKVLAFMDNCLKNGTFTSAEVQAYARGVEPDCEKLVGIGSVAQVGHWFEVLTEWKKLLGDEWGQTYALSNSIYVTRQNNILFSILVQFIGPEAINNRLILLETTDFQAKPEDMWGSFMRIVSDRTIGQCFFNNDRLMDYELLGFGGRDAIESEMAKIGKKAILPPLVPFNSTEWPWKTDPSKGTGPKSFDDLHKSGLL